MDGDQLILNRGATNAFDGIRPTGSMVVEVNLLILPLSVTNRRLVNFKQDQSPKPRVRSQVLQSCQWFTTVNSQVHHLPIWMSPA